MYQGADAAISATPSTIFITTIITSVTMTIGFFFISINIINNHDIVSSITVVIIIVLRLIIVSF